ncbi:MAG: hypothetical protein VB021_09680 [Oscillospiraceae bacterium]|nr:hypothetical protein [Oscillospiraceae bacterium]
MADRERYQELHDDVKEYAPAHAPVRRNTRKAKLRTVAAALAVAASALLLGGVELRCEQQYIGTTEADVDVRATSLTNGPLEGVEIRYRLEGEDEGSERALKLPGEALRFTGLTPATTYKILFDIAQNGSTTRRTYAFTTAGTGRGAAAPRLPQPPAALQVVLPEGQQPDDPPPPDIVEETAEKPKPAPQPAATYTAPTVSAMRYDMTADNAGILLWTVTAHDGKDITCIVTTNGGEPQSFTTAELDANFGDGSGNYNIGIPTDTGALADGAITEFTLTVGYTLNGAAGSVSDTGRVIVNFASGFSVALTANPDGTAAAGTAGFAISADALNNGTVSLEGVTAADTVSGGLTLTGDPVFTPGAASTITFGFIMPDAAQRNQVTVTVILRWQAGGVTTIQKLTYTGAYPTP